ncbi:MAG: ABC transporter permease [Planctomycetaceae bacterium]
MTRLVGAELLKVRTTRMWIVLLGVGAAIAALGAIALLAVAGSPDAARSGWTGVHSVADVKTMIDSGAIAATLALILGATIATTEFRYGTAGITYLATPRRSRVLTAKMIAAVPIGALFGLVGGAMPLVVLLIWYGATGRSVPLDGSVAVEIAQIGLQATFAAVMGVAVGAVLRSQVAAIIGLLVWVLVVESLVQGLLPAWIKWFPFGGVANAFSSQTSADLLARPAAAAMMVAYVAVGWVAAAWFEARRDV